MVNIKTVVVLYNLPESGDESDLDTEKTARDVVEGLRNKYTVELLGIKKADVEVVNHIKADLVFNLLEWTGPDLRLAVTAIKILEKTGIPFTGSDARGFRQSADKILMKREMRKFGIPTPVWKVVKTGREKLSGLPYPVIVKPVYEHCGVGVEQTSVCESDQETRNKIQEMIERYKQPVLVEEFILGRELHITVLESSGRPWVLPAAEVSYKSQEGYFPILSWDMKWNRDSWEYSMAGNMLIPVLDKDLETSIGGIARRCYVKLGGRDYPRLDVRVRAGRVYVLEINNNPGLDFEMDSGMGASARAAGFGSFEELLVYIVENAARRWSERGKYESAVA